jgi:hypothetical protein
MKLKTLPFLLLLFTYCLNNSFAQSKSKRYDAIVRTANGLRFKGLLESVDNKGLTIFHRRASWFIAADTIKTIWIKKYKAQNRTLLAGGLVGLASGLTVYAIEKDRGNVQPVILPVVIISSAFTGAAILGTINSITSLQKFEHVNRPDRFKEIKEELKSFRSISNAIRTILRQQRGLLAHWLHPDSSFRLKLNEAGAF